MSIQDSSEPRGSEPHGLTAMNGWWAASGLLILLVVFGVVAVIIWGGNGQTQAAAPALPAPSNSAAAGGGVTVDQMIPTTAPSGVTWDLYRGVALPISAVDGPSRRAGGIWSGYAQTPTGALLAASYLAYATTGPDAVAVLAQRTIPSPAQAAALVTAEATPYPAFNPGDTGAISGFSFADVPQSLSATAVPQLPSYSREAATIQVAGSGVGINMYSTVALRWVDGDWKLDLRAGFPIPGKGVPSLTGFVPWGAANG
jgi:hypothetical protein